MNKIILLNRTGQTCNQMFALASTIARGHLYGKRIICPMVGKDLSTYFDIEGNRDDDVITYVKLLEPISKVAHIIKNKTFNPLTNADQWLLNWDNSVDDDAMSKDRDNITQRIKFKKEDIKKVEDYFLNKNIDASKTIAIHIRRGDYKEWNNGRYFYSDDDYIRWIKEIKKQERNSIILIFSNEKLDKDKYSQIDNVYIHNGNVGQDLYAMSRCKCVIGPPSTFSAFASYMGNTRLIHLETNVQHIDIR